MTIIGELFHLKQENWIEHSLCGEKQRRAGQTAVVPDDFWHEKGQPDRRHHAKTLCNTCPVRLACLNYALAHKETDGVWGGLDKDQRRNLIAGRPLNYNYRLNLQPRQCARCTKQFEPQSNRMAYCSQPCRRADEVKTRAARRAAKRHGAA